MLMCLSLLAAGLTMGNSAHVQTVQERAEAQAILDRMNAYRSRVARGRVSPFPRATYMNELYWDPAIAKAAAKYAQECKAERNPFSFVDVVSQWPRAFLFRSERSLNYVPENRYFGESRPFVEVIDMWFQEAEATQFETKKCDFGPGNCGNFINMMDSDARFVGCASAECGGQTNYICYFGTARDLSRRSVYAGAAEAKSCSECPSDRQECRLGLCTGCPAFAYMRCGKDSVGSCSTHAARMCPDCGVKNMGFCMDCAKTCGFCDVDAKYLQGASTCDPLNPLGEGGAPSDINYVGLHGFF